MFAVGVRSEQAIVHSAPPPSILRFVLNLRISLLLLEVKLLGPLLRQNLERKRVHYSTNKLTKLGKYLEVPQST